MATTGTTRLRRTALLVGALATLGLAIWLFPTADPISPTGPTNSVPMVAAVPEDSPAGSAQTALDQVLGAGHSVVTASAVYGAGSSRRSTTYDPSRTAALSQSQATAPGYRASVTNNGVSSTVTGTSRARRSSE